MRCSLAEQFTISGYVRDGTTGEALGEATVYALRQETGTATSEDGFYRLTLKADSVQQ